MGDTRSLEDLNLFPSSYKEEPRIRGKAKCCDSAFEIEVSDNYLFNEIDNQSKPVNINCNQSFAIRAEFDSGYV